MKCTNKILLGIPVLALSLTLGGCSGASSVQNPYDVYTTTENYAASENLSENRAELMAANLCVGGQDNTETDLVDSSLASCAAVFCPETGEITYAQNIYEQIYPASTTKILTAYLALKYGNPDDMVTVSGNAVNTLMSGSSICGLKEGDEITLQNLLYGLMLESGNDAANVIAEYISGSTEEFADLMNEELLRIGATHTHFTNPHGLPDDDHYTTVYDMYLIFTEAMKNPEFAELLATSEKEVSYTSASGETVDTTWSSTNYYNQGIYEAPENITIIGGKTGTTTEAGCCLVLYTEKTDGNHFISMVYKSPDKASLYTMMNEMLANFSN